MLLTVEEIEKAIADAPVSIEGLGRAIEAAVITKLKAGSLDAPGAFREQLAASGAELTLDQLRDAYAWFGTGFLIGRIRDAS